MKAAVPGVGKSAAGCPWCSDPTPASFFPQGLFKGAGVLLKPGGVLFTYGVGAAPRAGWEHGGGMRGGPGDARALGGRGGDSLGWEKGGSS